MRNGVLGWGTTYIRIIRWGKQEKVKIITLQVYVLKIVHSFLSKKTHKTTYIPSPDPEPPQHRLRVPNPGKMHHVVLE